MPHILLLLLNDKSTFSDTQTPKFTHTPKVQRATKSHIHTRTHPNSDKSAWAFSLTHTPNSHTHPTPKCGAPQKSLRKLG